MNLCECGHTAPDHQWGYDACHKCSCAEYLAVRCELCRDLLGVEQSATLKVKIWATGRWYWLCDGHEADIDAYVDAIEVVP